MATRMTADQFAQSLWRARLYIFRRYRLPRHDPRLFVADLLTREYRPERGALQ